MLDIFLMVITLVGVYIAGALFMAIVYFLLALLNGELEDEKKPEPQVLLLNPAYRPQVDSAEYLERYAPKA